MTIVPQFLKDRPTLMKEIYDWHNKYNCWEAVCLELYKNCIICCTKNLNEGGKLEYQIWFMYNYPSHRLSGKNSCWGWLQSTVYHMV